MQTGSPELVKIVSKYLYLFLQIPLPSPLMSCADYYLRLTGTEAHTDSTQITHAVSAPARSGQRTVELSSVGLRTAEGTHHAVTVSQSVRERWGLVHD